MLPMSHERMMVGVMRLYSALLRPKRSVMAEALGRWTMRFSARMSTCDMENRPMRAQVVLTPLYRVVCPNMKRGTPSMGSMPMVEMSRPMPPEMRPLRMDLDDTPAMMVRPKSESQKYSGLLNFMASCASSGEKKYSEMQLKRPPQKEAKQAVNKALAALPRRVS